MNLLLNLVVALQIISALVMIGLVLVQHGKGADMGASFGSGSSGSLFGATGSVLDRPAVIAPAASGPLTGAAQVPGAASTPSAAAPAASVVNVPATPLPQASGAGAIPTK